MKYLGSDKRMLGMEIERNRTHGRLFISQTRNIEKVINKSGMHENKPMFTPLASDFKLSIQQCPREN